MRFIPVSAALLKQVYLIDVPKWWEFQSALRKPWTPKMDSLAPFFNSFSWEQH